MRPPRSWQPVRTHSLSSDWRRCSSSNGAPGYSEPETKLSPIGRRTRGESCQPDRIQRYVLHGRQVCMADTKQGRDKQAHDEAKRQRERDLEEARKRGDEAEPPADDSDAAVTCYRRGCTQPAAFVVLERYQEEGGHGAV